MREFAESEIIIPDGPFEGRKFSCSRQPYTRLWFEAIESNHWNRFVATGPVQSGKSLAGFVIPTLYHLCEVGETVICGVPAMDVAQDKWREDLLPVIEQTRYRDLLPTEGAGSKGGKAGAIQLRNGATLKFMSGGGSDKKRAGFTSRVLVVTETDGMDESGGNSREADKITQMEARTSAFGSRKRIYMECTVSTEDGRTWREYTGGTQTQIYLCCPHCHRWGVPEREHLIDWKDQETEIRAKRSGQFSCPNCGEAWSEQDRLRSHDDARLVHRGQEIDGEGNVHGELPETETLGFRWSAVNNMFLTSGDIAAKEHRASRAENEDNAEREMLQFVWAKPHKSPVQQLTPLEISAITARLGATARGKVPEEAQFLTLGIDLRMRELHWALLAWMPDASPLTVDKSVRPVSSDNLGVELAIMTALRDFRDEIQEGWPQGDKRKLPEQVWIDAGWKLDTVFDFIKESDQMRFRPCVGRGVGQYNTTAYSQPRTVNAVVKQIGEEYHLAWQAEKRVLLVEINADYWKGWVHQRLNSPLDTPGAMSLYHVANPAEHREYAQHLTAEKEVAEFIAGKGEVMRWVNEHRRPNHWFDCTYLASAAAHYCGVRLVRPQVMAQAPAPKRTSQPPTNRFSTPDGRPFLVTER